MWHHGSPGRPDEDTLARWGVDCTPDEAQAANGEELRTLLSPDGWKLTLSPALGQHELFDLSTDPQERANVYHDPAHAERVAAMTGRLRAWQQRTGDTAALPA